MLNVTGVDSSNGILGTWNDCDLAECAEYINMMEYHVAFSKKTLIHAFL